MSTTTTAPVLHPFLDDPVAFAHELFSVLAAGGDARILDPAGAAEQEDAAGATVAHASGIEFGTAAEALRRALLASAAGPRLPGLPEHRQPGN